MEPVRVADLAMVSVKLYKPDDLQFCFQLISPHTRAYVLQAHSQAALMVRRLRGVPTQRWLREQLCARGGV